MKSLLITNSNDAKIGLRLAGIEAQVFEDSHAALAALERAIDDHEIGLILLTDAIVDPIYEQVMALKLQVKHTMILTIPNPGSAFKDHIGQYVRDSIGIKY